MSSYRQHEGFTILEQLVAATVLLIIFAAVSQAFVGIGITNNRSNAQAQAVELLQEQVEEVRNTPFQELAIGSNNFDGDLSAFPALGKPNSTQQVVSEVTPGVLKKIEITISYTQSGIQRKIGTTTLVALRGLNR